MKWLVILSLSLSFSATAKPIVIPEIKDAKHEIGFVCLKEIQGGFNYPGQKDDSACAAPFQNYKSGNELPEKLPLPTWAKKSNGAVLTREDWAKIAVVMTGYEEGYGFKVWSSRADAVELRIESDSKFESVWIGKDKVQDFFPLSTLPICGVSTDKWWNQLYKADLKTKTDKDPSKSIPDDPFRGMEPAGFLEVKLNLKTQICSSLDSCVAAKVAVDPKLFKVDEVTGARITKVTSLNLAFEHFKGDSQGLGQPVRTDYLLVMDRKGENEYQLKAAIYDEPLVWVKIPKELQAGVKFLPVGDPMATKLFKSEKFQVPWFSKEFLSSASVIREGEKWQEGQFWIKAKVLYVDPCQNAELSEKKNYGEYWIPYSKNLLMCPKGC